MSKNQISIDFTLLFTSRGVNMDTSTGTIAVSFQGRTHKSNFHNQLRPWKEVWVISDLLLKIHADFQPMLLLVVSQQPWHQFCSKPPHVQFVRQNVLTCSV
jgi:hypothetical protein